MSAASGGEVAGSTPTSPTLIRIRRFAEQLINADDVAKLKIPPSQIYDLVRRAREMVLSDPAKVEVRAPIVVVGDVHGQYRDLKGVFEQNGWPPQTKYLFLGDYVDRGTSSIECICLLLCLKLIFPSHITLLRGNHETRIINKSYGFYMDCVLRYDTQEGNTVWEMFQTVFNCLPFCARINRRIFCTHGGISKELTDWQIFSNIHRPCCVPEFGLLCDLLWADPSNDIDDFITSPRGVSNIFGVEAVNAFCRDMHVDLIVRAHQVVQDGYEFFANRKLVTIFSAPHYCGAFDNTAAVLVVDTDLQCSFRVRRPQDHKWLRKQEPKKQLKDKVKSRLKKDFDQSESARRRMVSDANARSTVQPKEGQSAEPATPPVPETLPTSSHRAIEDDFPMCERTKSDTNNDDMANSACTSVDKKPSEDQLSRSRK